MKKRIILDIDDVCADCAAELIARENRNSLSQIRKEEFLNWDLDKSFPDRNLKQYFSEEGFFYSLKPIDGAIEYTRKLLEEGFEIVITTASPINGFVDKAKWIQKFFPHIGEKNLILAWRKDCVQGDIMLDDAPHNILNSICTYPVVFDQPWNRNIKDTYHRVHNWKEFYQLAKELYGC